MNVKVGSGWRTLRLEVGKRRWPTCMGENPPRGLPYTNVEASYGGRSIQIRLWNTRR